jgi:hypothetical protein
VKWARAIYRRFFQGADRTFEWSAQLADAIKKTLKSQGIPVKGIEIPGIAAPISSLYKLSLGMESHVMREAGILDYRALYTFNDWLEKQQAIGEAKAVGNSVGEYTQYILDTHVLKQRSVTEKRALAILQGDPKKVLGHLTQEGKPVTDRAAWRKAEEEELEPVTDPVTEVLVEPSPNKDGIVLGATVSYHTVTLNVPFTHSSMSMEREDFSRNWVNGTGAITGTSSSSPPLGLPKRSTRRWWTPHLCLGSTRSGRAAHVAGS